MKNRKRLILISLALIAVGVGSYYALRPTEPVYNGKRLSKWVDEYAKEVYDSMGAIVGTGKSESERAIREIGTNALPTLLNMVGRKDSALKQKWIDFSNRHSGLGLNLMPADYYRDQAMTAFWALGSARKPAVPALIELLHDEDKDIRICAAYILSHMGPDAEEAVPALVRALSRDRNEDADFIFSLISALGSIHAKPELAVPALVNWVDDSRAAGHFGFESILAIESFGAQAKMAVPVLVRQLGGTNESTSSAAMEALIMIDPETAAREKEKLKQ